MICFMARRSDRGGTGMWILILLLAYGGWVGYGIGRLYFDQSTIENEVAAIGDDALLSKRGGVREKVATLLDEYGAQYSHDKIVVDMNGAGDRMSISADYERSANLLFMSYPMAFRVYVQRQQSRGVGVINQIQESVEDSYNNSAQKYQKSLQGAAPGAAPSGE